MAKEIKDVDDIIHVIAEVLAESDGKFIEEIANKVLSHKVRYLGDSIFEIEE